MIDIHKEKLLTLKEVAARLPGRRPGKSVSLTTVYRWALRGVRGICLDTVLIGGVMCTSEEALQEFVERLTAARRSGPLPSASSRGRKDEDIDKQLDDIGL